MAENFNVGDRVVATEALGQGVNRGTAGVVTHVSVFHGLLGVRFANHATIPNVKLSQVVHA
ncbi:hypothetical protein [Streptomyces lacrimifluminis]|uniref:hypothetical protein n=1 Tax=Streptomyces lacrimifluminis TaxID=1500077 RepID=UPI00166503A5|nr:hypothetical protein [Streptomyces lacrimifluminis]